MVTFLRECSQITCVARPGTWHIARVTCYVQKNDYHSRDLSRKFLLDNNIIQVVMKVIFQSLKIKSNIVE